MTSINPYFTFQYSQPEDYHYSHDSVFLARWIFEKYQAAANSNLVALDLCAGSGVIGLDVLFHFLKSGSMPFRQFDFLEVQDIYKRHFDQNIQNLPTHELTLNWINQNYQKWTGEFQYDLIVCNPPYFRIGQGKLSPSDFKNRCRFFIDAPYLELMACLQRSLKKQGRAYVLLRDLKDHGWSPLEEARHHFSAQLAISIATQIRGTDVICFEKL